ncbi:Os02g0569800 [Oryza sativa Japonica Group]|uniref:Os02g0569800 protein n=1 Tax=Oryza sativa subsp. japonica TaxID=39947 RepID=A0A0P0VKS7_ORYSJ|nr:Os02g0569800 [Oryza sativa Japonica Group]
MLKSLEANRVTDFPRRRLRLLFPNLRFGYEGQCVDLKFYALRPPPSAALPLNLCHRRIDGSCQLLHLRRHREPHEQPPPLAAPPLHLRHRWIDGSHPLPPSPAPPPGAFLRISAPLSPLRPPPPPSHTVSPLHSLPGNCESIPAGGDLASDFSVIKYGGKQGRVLVLLLKLNEWLPPLLEVPASPSYQGGARLGFRHRRQWWWAGRCCCRIMDDFLVMEL